MSSSNEYGEGVRVEVPAGLSGDRLQEVATLLVSNSQLATLDLSKVTGSASLAALCTALAAPNASPRLARLSLREAVALESAQACRALLRRHATTLVEISIAVDSELDRLLSSLDDATSVAGSVKCSDEAVEALVQAMVDCPSLEKVGKVPVKGLRNGGEEPLAALLVEDCGDLELLLLAELLIRNTFVTTLSVRVPAGFADQPNNSPLRPSLALSRMLGHNATLTSVKFEETSGDAEGKAQKPEWLAEFCEALSGALGSNTTLETLELVGKPLTNTLCCAVGAALEAKTGGLKHLKLPCPTSRHREIAPLLVKGVAENPHLESIHVRQRLDLKAMRGDAKLDKLDLSSKNESFGDAEACFAAHIFCNPSANPSMDTLQLSRNGFSAFGWKEMAKLLTSNCNFKNLSTPTNNLNKEAVAVMVEAMWQAPNLRSWKSLSGDFTELRRGRQGQPRGVLKFKTWFHNLEVAVLAKILASQDLNCVAEEDRIHTLALENINKNIPGGLDSLLDAVLPLCKRHGVRHLELSGMKWVGAAYKAWLDSPGGRGTDKNRLLDIVQGKDNSPFTSLGLRRCMAEAGEDVILDLLKRVADNESCALTGFKIEERDKHMNLKVLDHIVDILRNNDKMLDVDVEGLSSLKDNGTIKLLEAAALHPALRSLNMNNVQAGEITGPYLSKLLASSKTLKSLYLHDNEIMLQGMKDLCAGLQSNTTLAELSCDYNVSEGQVGPIMGTALKDTRIERLRASGMHMNLVGAVGLLGPLKDHPTITDIDLYSNEIGKRGVGDGTALAEALLGISRLRKFSLLYNEFKATGQGTKFATTLAAGLTAKQLPHLKELYLNYCKLDGAGGLALADAAMAHPTLESFNDIPFRRLQANDPSLTVLKFTGCEVPNALGTDHIDDLNGEIGIAGARILSKVLKGNTHVVYLEHYGPLGGPVGLSELLPVLHTHPTITTLKLTSLEAKRMHEETFMLLAQLIKLNAVLTTLDISYILNDADADRDQDSFLAIIRALHTNSTLLHFDCDVDFGPQHSSLFHTVLAHNATLRRITTGNETLDKLPSMLRPVRAFLAGHAKLDLKAFLAPAGPWLNIVRETDAYAGLVSRLCDALDMQQLVGAVDKHGRRAADIATPACKQAIMSRIYFFGRYELIGVHPVHRSATCVVRFAVDHGAPGGKQSVCLKLMSQRDQFAREVRGREVSQLDTQFVLGVKHWHDGERDEAFRAEAAKKTRELVGEGGEGDEGAPLPEYPFCLVMERGERNLSEAIMKERFAGQNMALVCSIARQIGVCLEHLHQRGLLHADLKPLNIMRVDGTWRLIDLDAAALLPSEGAAGDAADEEHERKRAEELDCTVYAGAKFSSAFVPPELVDLHGGQGGGGNHILARVKTFMTDGKGKALTDGLPYGLVRARASHDLWAFGAVLYHLVVGKSLFHADNEDNLEEADLLRVGQWDAATKTRLLSVVSDRFTRNLLSRLLEREPKLRPCNMKEVLSHPFFTKGKAARLIGEKPTFDVFLSYRVWCDSPRTEALYKLLTEKHGLAVYYDKVCLEAGKDWEDGFCAGLMSSRMFVPLLSNSCLKSMTDLTQDSHCDNVLLEHRLALELRELGLVEFVFPLMMGEPVEEGMAVLGKFTAWDAGSQAVVTAVESKLAKHLSSQSLGAPLRAAEGSQATLSEILKCQGAFVSGDPTRGLEEAAEAIAKACAAAKEGGKGEGGEEQGKEEQEVGEAGEGVPKDEEKEEAKQEEEGEQAEAKESPKKEERGGTVKMKGKKASKDAAGDDVVLELQQVQPKKATAGSGSKQEEAGERDVEKAVRVAELEAKVAQLEESNMKLKDENEAFALRARNSRKSGCLIL